MNSVDILSYTTRITFLHQNKKLTTRMRPVIVLLAIMAVALAQDYAAWTSKTNKECANDFARLCKKSQENLEVKENLLAKAQAAAKRATVAVAKLQAELKTALREQAEELGELKAAQAAANEASKYERTICSRISPSLDKPVATFKVYCDDVLNYLQVNGKNVPVPRNEQGELRSWNVLKTLSARATSGDRIAVSITNLGGPAGLMATINYVNGNGKKVQFSTSGSWKCGGAPAAVEGTDVNNASWGRLPGVAQNAAWIWQKGNPMSTVCTAVLP